MVRRRVDLADQVTVRGTCSTKPCIGDLGMQHVVYQSQGQGLSHLQPMLNQQGRSWAVGLNHGAIIPQYVSTTARFPRGSPIDKGDRESR